MLPQISETSIQAGSSTCMRVEVVSGFSRRPSLSPFRSRS